MRITGGEWRSRVLQVPADVTTTRPTMDQTRQAVFNILNSAAWAQKPNGQTVLIDATVLDGYAGTGAMAFEALSRGAAFATLMDKNVTAVQTIQKNAEALKCTAQTKALRMDVLKVVGNPGAAVTICFLDPPYDDETWPTALKQLKMQRWINEDTLIVLETNSKRSREANELAEGVLDIHDQRRYGHSLVIFANLSI